MKITYRPILIGATLLTFVTSITADATSRRLKKVDGKLVAVERTSGKTNINLTCDGANYFVLAQTFNNQDPKFYVAVNFGQGEKKTRIAISDELNDMIQSEHKVQEAKYGCLSGGGGLGMHIPSLDESTDLFIQISEQGRVFQGFNETGYIILGEE